MNEPIHVGFLLFPNVTQLDLTGPAQILSRVPNAKVHLIWKTLAPVMTDVGFTINPTTTFKDCPPLAVLCVPGGFGIDDLFNDAETLEFLRLQGASARYVTSVCNGSLVLGAAIGCGANTFFALARNRLQNGWCAIATVSPAAA